MNGKRRHGTSNVTVSLTGGFGGAAAADLTYIPVAAIGVWKSCRTAPPPNTATDAVAGVINIILKDSDHGGAISATGGSYYEGDGRTGSFSANIGFAPWDGSHINLSLEQRSHGYSDRGADDARFFTAANLANPALKLVPGYPHTNYIFGDARYDLTLAAFDASANLGGGDPSSTASAPMAGAKPGRARTTASRISRPRSGRRASRRSSPSMKMTWPSPAASAARSASGAGISAAPTAATAPT